MAIRFDLRRPGIRDMRLGQRLDTLPVAGEHYPDTSMPHWSMPWTCRDNNPAKLINPVFSVSGTRHRTHEFRFPTSALRIIQSLPAIPVQKNSMSIYNQ